jgi:hypothetical protein
VLVLELRDVVHGADPSESEAHVLPDASLRAEEDLNLLSTVLGDLLEKDRDAANFGKHQHGQLLRPDKDSVHANSKGERESSAPEAPPCLVCAEQRSDWLSWKRPDIHGNDETAILRQDGRIDDGRREATLTHERAHRCFDIRRPRLGHWLVAGESVFVFPRSNEEGTA